MSTAPARPTSIRIFLVDGTPEGLRLVEKSNWTGQAVAVSRAQYPEVRHRPEFYRPGVYLLRGPAESPGFDTRIYVGQAEAARPRLDAHARSKEFWTQLILFTSKDDNLNTAHVRYLESRLIALASQAKRAELDNGVAPQLPSLSEADQADAESFLQEMLVLYPILGVQAFEVARDEVRKGPRLFLSGREATGEGYDLPEGFLVLAGSRLRMQATPGIQNYVEALRQRLLQEGVLAVDAGQLLLTQDYTFSSPSTAAAVLLARSATGLGEWKDDQGRTLREIREAALDNNQAAGEDPAPTDG